VEMCTDTYNMASATHFADQHNTDVKCLSGASIGMLQGMQHVQQGTDMWTCVMHQGPVYLNEDSVMRDNCAHGLWDKGHKQRLYLHALFTSSLLLQQLLFAADVTSIAFGKHILAHCCVDNQPCLSVQDAWCKCLPVDSGLQHAHKKPVKSCKFSSKLISELVSRPVSKPISKAMPHVHLQCKLLQCLDKVECRRYLE